MNITYTWKGQKGSIFQINIFTRKEIVHERKYTIYLGKGKRAQYFRRKRIDNLIFLQERKIAYESKTQNEKI